MTLSPLSVLRPVREEFQFLREYAKTRPRFRVHLAVDALLSIALVVAVFQITSAPSRHRVAETQKISGAYLFSSNELVKYVKQANLDAFWAGPMSDDKYTLIATVPGEVTISYFSSDASIDSAHDPDLVIQTHKHFTQNEAGAFSRDLAGAGSFLMSQGETGNSIQYNPATPTKVIVTIKDQLSAVTIYDSIPQASLTMAMKPGEIQKIA